MLGCWDAEMLGCWDAGMLGCWDAGMLGWGWKGPGESWLWKSGTGGEPGKRVVDGESVRGVREAVDWGKEYKSRKKH